MLSSTASDEYDRDDFDQPPLTSDCRRRPPSTVPPSQTIASETPPHVAISVSSYNNYSTKRQDVRSVLNSSASFRPPSPAPRFNAFPATPLETPVFGLPPVFPSTNELAAHYGLPQHLPPPPRPGHRHSSSHQPAPKQSSPVFDFDSIRKNYLTMLSQNPSEPEPAAADNTATTVAPAELPSATDSTMQAIRDLLGNAPSLSRRSPSVNRFAVPTASPEFRENLGDSFDPTSPLFSDSGASPLFEDAGSFDVDAYLTSPMETPYDDFATSPADDSPFSDFLTTPVLPSASDADMLTGPLIDDGGYGDNMSLFGGLSNYAYEVPVESAPKLPTTTNLYTISPGTPALDSIDPTTTVFPPKPKSAVAASPAPEGPTTRRRTTATGTRKNLKPEALIPLEAPTQKRTYLTPSATSRKAVPAVFQKKRQHSVAFGDDDLEELGQLSPTASEAETIEYKRRQNTLAARKSRKRKLEHQQQLEEQVVFLQSEVERWKTRALMGQDMLRANGVAFTPFED
ncbi:BZIP domain-containing protein [Mycena venus]|uniref:BZIP domain-containing protein n=1 Tax=Mycena venus TaxID=2733690 RepID=A0A8H7D5P1_9AGAR|nr:BZIP domain-containing protein [Mycena venus]